MYLMIQVNILFGILINSFLIKKYIAIIFQFFTNIKLYMLNEPLTKGHIF
jgi:hypothetical protein